MLMLYCKVTKGIFLTVNFAQTNMIDLTTVSVAC